MALKANFKPVLALNLSSVSSSSSVHKVLKSRAGALLDEAIALEASTNKEKWKVATCSTTVGVGFVHSMLLFRLTSPTCLFTMTKASLQARQQYATVVSFRPTSGNWLVDPIGACKMKAIFLGCRITEDCFCMVM